MFLVSDNFAGGQVRQIHLAQRRHNVFDDGPTLYKCYKNVLCLVGYLVIGEPPFSSARTALVAARRSAQFTENLASANYLSWTIRFLNVVPTSSEVGTTLMQRIDVDIMQSPPLPCLHPEGAEGTDPQRCWSNAILMVVHRLRRWPNIRPAFVSVVRCSL